MWTRESKKAVENNFIASSAADEGVKNAVASLADLKLSDKIDSLTLIAAQLSKHSVVPVVIPVDSYDNEPEQGEEEDFVQEQGRDSRVVELLRAFAVLLFRRLPSDELRSLDALFMCLDSWVSLDNVEEATKALCLSLGCTVHLIIATGAKCKVSRFSPPKTTKDETRWLSAPERSLAIIHDSSRDRFYPLLFVEGWSQISEGGETKEDDRRDEQLKGECTICLDDVTPSTGGKGWARLVDCRHLFHSDCIHAWSKIVPTCPLCKQQIFKYLVPAPSGLYPHVWGLKDVPSRVEAPSESESTGSFQAMSIEDARSLPRETYQALLSDPDFFVEEELVSICSVCGRGDREESLLLCDGRCGRSGHVDCMGLSAVPEGDWFCPICSTSRAADSSPFPTRRNVHEYVGSRRRASSSRETERSSEEAARERFISEAAAGISGLVGQRRSRQRDTLTPPSQPRRARVRKNINGGSRSARSSPLGTQSDSVGNQSFLYNVMRVAIQKEMFEGTVSGLECRQVFDEVVSPALEAMSESQMKVEVETGLFQIIDVWLNPISSSLLQGGHMHALPLQLRYELLASLSQAPVEACAVQLGSLGPTLLSIARGSWREEVGRSPIPPFIEEAQALARTLVRRCVTTIDRREHATSTSRRPPPSKQPRQARGKRRLRLASGDPPAQRIDIHSPTSSDDEGGGPRPGGPTSRSPLGTGTSASTSSNNSSEGSQGIGGARKRLRILGRRRSINSCSKSPPLSPTPALANLTVQAR